MWFDFRWIEWNLSKIDNHGVTSAECEYVIRSSVARRSGDKFIVVGRTKSGRRIKVVYLVDDDNITAFVLSAFDN
jgi:hypothetical protein